MISSIHLCRGLAALSVAIYHVNLIILERTGFNAYGRITDYGYLGVPYFFVLSGFIICHSHYNDINQPQKLPGYAWKRFTRVYPVYWLFSLLFIIAAAAGIGQTEFKSGMAHSVEYITLVHFTPEFSAPPLKVAWTLFYEVRFYILFGLAIYNLRIALVALALWVGATALLTPWNDLTVELLSFWSFAFCFGVAANVVYRKMDAKHWLALTLIGFALVLFVFSGGALELKDKRSWMIFPVSFGFAGIMLGLALAEKRAPFRIGALGRKLGDASYVLYLTHSAVISACVIVVTRLHLDRYVSFRVLFFPILAAAVIGGVLAHELVEKRITRMIRSRSAPTKRSQARG